MTSALPAGHRWTETADPRSFAWRRKTNLGVVDWCYWREGSWGGASGHWVACGEVSRQGTLYVARLALAAPWSDRARWSKVGHRPGYPTLVRAMRVVERKWADVELEAVIQYGPGWLEARR